MELGVLTVHHCADQLHLSANYFGDLNNLRTGLPAKSLNCWGSIIHNMVAGFLKNKVGHTPVAFRKQYTMADGTASAQ